MRVFPNIEDKWYFIILRWEMLRIVYNGVMLIAGLMSVFIAAVNIPLIYIMIGLVFNLIFTLVWLVDLYLLKKKCIQTSEAIFKYFTSASIILVFCLPVIILNSMSG